MPHEPQIIISSECNGVHLAEIVIAVAYSSWEWEQISTSVKTMFFFILKEFYLFNFSPQIYYFNFKEQFTKMLKNNDLDKPGHYELQKL